MSEQEILGHDMDGTPLYEGTRIVYARAMGRNAAYMGRATVLRRGALNGCKGCYGEQHLIVMVQDHTRPTLLHYGEEVLVYDWSQHDA